MQRIPRTLESIRERCKIDDASGCWIWCGPTKGNSQKTPILGRVNARELAYELEIGDNLDRFVIEPECRNDRCVNPHHQSARNPIPMGQRTSERNSILKSKTHCRHGHEYAVHGVYVTKRKTRQCLGCMKISRAKWLAKQGASA